jgi:hypothetical protein
MRGVLAARAVRAEIEAMGDDYCANRREEFVGLIRAIQQAATPRDFLAVQVQLRDTFAGRQHGLDHIRQLLKADRTRLRQLAPRKPQPREVAVLRERIAVREKTLLRDDVIQHVTRCLADALVWKATLYDRALFSVLGDGERVGRFPDEAGAEIERQRAQEIVDAGALPFFNDLTNCLRHGDLTILHSRWPDADVALHEVKRSGRNQRGTSQSERLDRKLRLLSDGLDATGADGQGLRLQRLPLTYRHDLDALAAVLAQARATGHAELQTNAAVIVSAVDLRWAAEHEDEFGPWTTYAAAARGWDLAAPGIFADSALLRRLRERRNAGSAYHAPLGIFPLCAEDIADLLFGRFDYTSVLSVDALAPAFAARDIEVRFARGSEANEVFLHARRGSDDIVVPAHLRDQMLRELMTVETLIDTVDMLLADRRGSAAEKLIVVSDERSSWGWTPRYLAA